MKQLSSIFEDNTIAAAILIDWLGREQIDAMAAYHCEGLTMEQIAQRMDTNRWQVSRWLSQARIKLRRVGALPEAWQAGATPRPAPLARGSF